MLDKLKNLAENVSLWQWLIGSFLVVSLSCFKIIRSLILFMKREINFQNNLDRPVLIIKPTEKEAGDQASKFNVPMNMERETELLKQSKLFKVEGPITADTVTTKIKNHGLIVLGYCEGMGSFQDVLNTAKVKQIPIIIYTFGCNNLSTNDLAETKKYPWHTFSNFPVRLVSEVFSILSTFQHSNESKKK